MFINKRARGKDEYYYIEHSYRLDGKVKKISFYMQKNKPFNLSEFVKLNEKAINKITNEKVELYKKKYKQSSFFNYPNILENIEKIRTTFHILFTQLDKKSQDEIIDEYLRKSITSSMEMEGGTITYEVALEIDKSTLKEIPLKVNPLDIDLYKNIKKAYNHIEKTRIRRASAIAKIHGEMYNDIYGFAGNFKKQYSTFGLFEKAKTSLPKNVVKDLNNALDNYTKNKKGIYPFEAILKFHIEYQAVHPFKDGNSRLGRLLITHDLIKNGYPPPILKAKDSNNYRKYLVESINNKHTNNFYKLYYEKYKSTWQKFFSPILKEKIEKSIIFKEQHKVSKK